MKCIQSIYVQIRSFRKSGFASGFAPAYPIIVYSAAAGNCICPPPGWTDVMKVASIHSISSLFVSHFTSGISDFCIPSS